MTRPFRSPIIIAAGLVAVLTTPLTAKPRRPLTPSGIALENMDRTVRPGDDFYAYANGNWEAKTKIPEDSSFVASFQPAQQDIADRMDRIMAGLADSKASAGTNERKLADYAKAFMNQAVIDQRTPGALRTDLARFDSIADRRALAEAIGSTIRADLNTISDSSTDNLFGLFVMPALSDPSKNMANLYQGGTELSGQDYLSSDPHSVETQNAYRQLIAKMLVSAGYDEAEARARRVFDLESKLAAARTAEPDSDDYRKANNPWARTEFARNAPGMDWDAFFGGAQLSKVSIINVWQPDAARKFSALVASEPLQSWKDWLAFHLIVQSGPVLPSQMRRDRFAFFGTTLNGFSQEPARQRQLHDSLTLAMGDALGQLYVARHFPASSKIAVEHMVAEVKAAFGRRISALKWMNPATRREARAKVAAMQVNIGYPDKWRDYRALEIRPDDAYGNHHRALKAEYQRQLGRLNEAPDRRVWWMVPQVIDALNIPQQNAIIIPAGIMEPPIYRRGSDPAATYGAIGAMTVGHEISHGFDDSGSNIDADGRLRNWWTPDDLARFKAAGEALVTQYDGYEVLPGLKVNGRRTLGENIADLAGLAAAYDAYRASLRGKGAPVIDGLTGDQRFFIAFAQVWTLKMREKTLRQMVAEDGHAPWKYRALTVRNLDAWYKAFNVRPGNKLYLPPNKRIRVW